MTAQRSIAGQWYRLAVVAACVFLFAGVAGHPARAATQPAQASIIKGTPAPIAAFPSLAFIAHFGLAELNECTGTVVAPRVVLTAGHCVQDLEHGGIQLPEGYGVATGVADLRELSRRDVSEVTRALIFPGFSLTSLQNDAGLLILSEPVAAPPLPLAGPADGALLSPGTQLTIAGWGLVRGDAKNGSPILRSGNSVVQETAFCRKRTAAYGGTFFPSSQLCAILPPQLAVGSCHGDSGGPAIARRPGGSPVQIGIISSGQPDCQTVFPELLTRVDLVASWVAEWIAAVETGAPAPAIRIPKVVLPKMPISVARRITPLVLTSVFKGRYSSSSERRCSRVSKAKVNCAVAWDKGGNDYVGSVAVSNVLRPEGVFQEVRYKIEWVSDRCLRDHKRENCPAKRQFGSGIF